MAKWKPWQSYEEVPANVLKYAYNDKGQIEARDPAYLLHLNQIFNAQPMRERAETKKGLPCFVCDKRLTPDEAEARVCTRCQERVKKDGFVNVAGGFGVRVTKPSS